MNGNNIGVIGGMQRTGSCFIEAYQLSDQIECVIDKNIGDKLEQPGVCVCLCEIVQYRKNREEPKKGEESTHAHTHTHGLRRWDMRKENRGGMVQVNPSMLTVHCRCLCTSLNTQDKTECLQKVQQRNPQTDAILQEKRAWCKPSCTCQ